MNLKHKWMRLVPAVLLVAGFTTMNQAQVTFAAGIQQGSFELDVNSSANPAVGAGNVAVDGTCSAGVTGYSTTNGCVDWASLFDSSGNAKTLPPAYTGTSGAYLTSAFTQDFTAGSTRDATTFATGSKDTLNISGGGWQCTASNNIGNKVDLMNTYAAAASDSAGNLLLYAGAERNSAIGTADLGIWLLQDPTVGCNSGKSATNFAGTHNVGDILLTSGYPQSNGAIPPVLAYEWNGTGLTGPITLGSSTDASCASATSSTLACGSVNVNNAFTPPWQTQTDKCSPTASANCSVNPQEFFEGGFNVTQALQQLTGSTSTPCFSNILIDTRSSTSSTATIFDYTLHSFNTCGKLSVNKYIDVNANGQNDAGDVTSGNPVAGWQFSVAGPSPSTKVVCSGTTDTTGTLICSGGTALSQLSLQPGTYTVTETQQSNFYNTDPGPFPNTSATVTKTVAVGLAGMNSVSMGNTCFVAKTFQVANVPTDVTAPSSITAFYTITGGPGASSTQHTVSLTSNGSGTWSATVGGFYQANTITWGYSINGSTDPADQLTVATNESLASGAYPTCSVTNTAQYPRYTLLGSKFKDINGDGLENGSDAGVQGFQFNLMSGTTQVGSTATSDTTGAYSFSNVAPGTYQSTEVGPPTGWVETTPNPSVTVHLDGSGGPIPAIGDTPLSDVSLTFSPEATIPGTNTAATKATMSCTDASGKPVGSQSGNTYSANGTQLNQSVITCTYTITDP